MEKTRSIKREMDGNVNHHFFPVNIMIKVLFFICTLNGRVNHHVSRQGKGINRRNESAIVVLNFCSFSFLYSFFEIINCLLLLKHFSLIKEVIDTFVIKLKSQISLSN